LDSPVWTLLRGLARGLQMAGTFGLFGTAFLAATLLRGEAEAGLKRLGWVSLAVALLAGTAWFLLQAGYFASAGSWQDVWTALPIVVQNTRFGALLLGRSAALIAAAALLQCGWPRLGALIACGAVIAESWLGHGGAMVGAEGDILLATSVAHLASSAAWLGSLPALRLGLRHLPMPEAQRLAQKFSPLGIFCVSILVLTAAIQYFLLIGHPASLFTTAYGVTALAKILLLGALIALAATNRQRLTPNLPASRPQLLRSIDWEIALGLAALIAAGLILQLEPPTMASMGQ
jgi:putative copper resistance protein D